MNTYTLIKIDGLRRAQAHALPIGTPLRRERASLDGVIAPEGYAYAIELKQDLPTFDEATQQLARLPDTIMQAGGGSYQILVNQHEAVAKLNHVPAQVEVYKLRIVLKSQGLDVDAEIAKIADPAEKLAAEEAWNHGHIAERDHPVIQSLQVKMNLDDDTADQLFIEASKLFNTQA